MGHNAIALLSRGSSRYVDTPMNEPSTDCVGCGSCAVVCPTDCIPVTMLDGKRVIWNKQFEMVRCKSCGTAHITVDQARFHLKKTGLDKSYFDLCDECSRRDIAQRFLEHVI
jgi:Fe-S-cluster-containing hydrogenase component 2